jgi:hypothetical protein
MAKCQFQKISESQKVFQKISESQEMFQNISDSQKMFQKISESQKMFQFFFGKSGNVSKKFRKLIYLPQQDRARVRARLGPVPAGGPARKAKGGVRGSAAEGGRGRAEEKKTKNCLRPHRTHQQHGGKDLNC